MGSHGSSDAHKARARLEREYKVSGNGVVRSPGPFEACPLYVVFFWEEGAYDEEFTDEFDRKVSVVFPDKDDLAAFPELGDAPAGPTTYKPGAIVRVAALWLWEDDQGFVRHRAFGTEAEEKSAREEVEEAIENEEGAEEAGEDEDEPNDDDDESDADKDKDLDDAVCLESGHVPDKNDVCRECGKALEQGDQIRTPRHRIGSDDYTHYVVVNGKIVSGWENASDARDAKREIREDRRDLKPEVIGRRALKAAGLDPNPSSSSWTNVHEIPKG